MYYALKECRMCRHFVYLKFTDGGWEEEMGSKKKKWCEKRQLLPECTTMFVSLAGSGPFFDIFLRRRTFFIFAVKSADVFRTYYLPLCWMDPRAIILFAGPPEGKVSLASISAGNFPGNVASERFGTPSDSAP